MADITTLLYQYLTTQFSKLDWEPGSIIRELVAEPIVNLSEQAVNAVENVYNSMDVSVLEAAPEENAEAINNLFNLLGLTSPAPSGSSGKVKLLVSSPADISIVSGTSFTYNDIVLSVPTSMTVTPTAIGANSYEAEVPVVTTVGIGGISKGTELTWGGSPTPALYSVVVSETITGGFNTYTATQKLNLIRQFLAPQSLTCREGLLRTINGEYPELAADCMPLRVGVNQMKLVVKPTSAPTNVVNQVVTFPTISNAQTAINRYTSNTGINIEVAQPRALKLQMYLPTVGTLNSAILGEIVTAINNSELNATSIGDSTVLPILSKYNVTMQGAGTYTLIDYATGATMSSLATINPTIFMTTNIPYAIYSALDLIAHE